MGDYKYITNNVNEITQVKKNGEIPSHNHWLKPEISSPAIFWENWPTKYKIITATKNANTSFLNPNQPTVHPVDNKAAIRAKII